MARIKGKVASVDVEKQEAEELEPTPDEVVVVDPEPPAPVDNPVIIVVEETPASAEVFLGDPSAPFLDSEAETTASMESVAGFGIGSGFN